MPRYETQVSKTDPVIKKIIAATSGSDSTEWPSSGSPAQWRGRLVSVEQVDPGFTYQIYNDTGEPRVYQVRNLQARMLTVSRVPRPSYGAPATEIFAPAYGEVVVTRQIGPTGRITIYVPELDAATLDVSRDALLSGDKKRFTEVLKGFGDYAGIARAILEAQSKMLEKVSSGKTSRQLDREITDFLRSRNQ
jgi:hypothetical protein